MSFIFQIGDIHLAQQSALPNAGGDPRDWASTPFAVGEKWTPNAAKPKMLYSGSGPFVNGQTPLFSSYDNVDDTIPITVYGSSQDNVAQLLQALKLALSTATYSQPAIWRSRRSMAAANELYAEIYEATVQEESAGDELTAFEGGTLLEAKIQLKRSPFFGAKALATLLDAQSYTNSPSGNVVSLGALSGDLAHEGQPINIIIDKPASQSAASLMLASVQSRLNATVNEAKTTSSTTTGTAYTATSSLNVSALRTRRGVHLRIVARVKTLTAPSVAQLRPTVQTSSGVTLWVGQWRTLSTDTTAQLIDLGATTLDGVRLPIDATVNVKVLIELRSTSGASVTATLDYVEALICYDYCVVECSGGLAAAQRFELFAAQNLSGGGWLPMMVEAGGAFNASDEQLKPARILGTLPRAYTGASLYVAWYDSGRAHTDTDTATVTINHAPLWRTMRGIT
jgi:hypothetical protein